MQRSELFDKQAQAWLKRIGMEGQEPLATAITIGQGQILEDVRAGLVPADVESFGNLHDHVDANGYGSAFDWPSPLPSDSDDGAYGDAFCTFWNRVQDSLHTWIATGGLRDRIAAIRAAEEG